MGGRRDRPRPVPREAGARAGCPGARQPDASWRAKPSWRSGPSPGRTGISSRRSICTPRYAARVRRRRHTLRRGLTGLYTYAIVPLVTGSLGLRTTIPQRVDLRENVYRLLKRYVLDVAGSKAATVRLQESALARNLGVSRTPVREALSRLQQEGLVVVSRYRGASVVPKTTDEYLALLEVREVLEGLAARLAASRIDDAMLSRMRRFFDGFSPEDTKRRPAQYAVANVRFHRLLTEVAGNPVLERVLTGLQDHMRMTQFRIIERLGRGPASFSEHKGIIQALEQRDAQLSEQLARAHIRALRKAVKRGLGRLQDGTAAAVGGT